MTPNPTRAEPSRASDPGSGTGTVLAAPLIPLEVFEVPKVGATSVITVVSEYGPEPAFLIAMSLSELVLEKLACPSNVGVVNVPLAGSR